MKPFAKRLQNYWIRERVLGGSDAVSQLFCDAVCLWERIFVSQIKNLQS